MGGLGEIDELAELIDLFKFEEPLPLFCGIFPSAIRPS